MKRILALLLFTALLSSCASSIIGPASVSQADYYKPKPSEAGESLRSVRLQASPIAITYSPSDVNQALYGLGFTYAKRRSGSDPGYSLIDVNAGMGTYTVDSLSSFNRDKDYRYLQALYELGYILQINELQIMFQVKAGFRIEGGEFRSHRNMYLTSSLFSTRPGRMNPELGFSGELKYRLGSNWFTGFQGGYMISGGNNYQLSYYLENNRIGLFTTAVWSSSIAEADLVHSSTNLNLGLYFKF